MQPLALQKRHREQNIPLWCELSWSTGTSSCSKPPTWNSAAFPLQPVSERFAHPEITFIFKNRKGQLGLHETWTQPFPFIELISCLDIQTSLTEKVHSKDALSQMARDKHNSTSDPQYKHQDNTSIWQLWVWLHPEKQSKKILLNPAELASLLQKTGIVYMPIPLLPAALERTVLANSSRDSDKLYRFFSLWNIFCYNHKYEQATILIERKLLSAASLK